MVYRHCKTRLGGRTPHVKIAELVRSLAFAHLLSDLFMNYRTVTICMATMVECSESAAHAHSPASGMNEWNGSEAGVERVRPMRKGCMIMILDLVY
jgi:hypothetical protein